MIRRLAGVVPVVFVVIALAAAGAPPAERAGPALGAAAEAVVPQAAVGWPPSAGLLIAEVVTGGASASDEYVELTNAAAVPLDLAGFELVYVTSSGGTVTRKAAWSGPLLLAPGQHLLVANVLGRFASDADAMYSGGLAATGGTLVLRPIGGAPVDAVGWGDATNSFVEGSPAVAPPPDASIERRPGGAAGNGSDTNDNGADWFVQPAPVPQNLAAPPTPTPAPTPTPTPEPTPSPTPTPTPAPSLSPSPSPSPSLSIAAARALPLGSTVSVGGILTTDLGALESGRGAFVQDPTAGISIYLAAPASAAVPAGSVVSLTGILDSRYGQLVVRASEADLVVLGTAPLPEPVAVATGAAGEPLEGSRVVVRGRITESPSSLADGLGLTVDDGSGPLRVVVGPAALGDAVPARGDEFVAIGPLGQRDRSGTGSGGYRVHATLAGEFVLNPPPTGTPTPAPSAPPDPSPTGSPSPAPTATPAPTSTPSPTPLASTIAAVRSKPIGTVVRVTGTVTAESGRLGQPALVAVADETGAIVVRLGDADPRPARGDLVVVSGSLADPYGQLEVRGTREFVRLGPGSVPDAVPVRAVDLGEATEARLVRILGVVRGSVRRATSGDITFDLVDDDGASVRIMADGSSGLTAGSFRSGARYDLVGIVGQRSSRKGTLDGYRIWLRDAGDVLELAAPPPTPTATPTTASPSPIPSVPIRSALRAVGRIAVEGTVTVPATLLDATGRRIVVEDPTGAVEVLLPTGVAAPAVGEGIRAIGTMGRAYGAPRLRATAVERLGPGRPVAPARLDRAPGPADEWRLVRVSGRIVEVRRLGGRWRAELALGSDRVVVEGLAGARIPASALVEGRSATVVGIVRRPYPTATDRRFAVVPRGPSDVAVGPAGEGGPPGAAGGSGAAPGREPFGSGPPDVVDVDLADLGAHVTARVRVGGLVAELTAEGFVLDDGTATAAIRLEGQAAEYGSLIEPGDAVNVIGTVRSLGSGTYGVVVDDPSGLVPVGDLGEASGFSEAAAVSAAPAGSPPVEAGGPRSADLGSQAGAVPAVPIGLVVGGSVVSILVSLAVQHRTRLRRAARLEARIEARLAAIRRRPAP